MLPNITVVEVLIILLNLPLLKKKRIRPVRVLQQRFFYALIGSYFNWRKTSLPLAQITLKNKALGCFEGAIDWKTCLSLRYNPAPVWNLFVDLWAFSAVLCCHFIGMTMVKLGKGEENTPVDFINKRRAALER